MKLASAVIQLFKRKVVIGDEKDHSVDVVGGNPAFHELDFIIEILTIAMSFAY